MNKLICDICGGAIVVQAGGKYGICDSCGANYTLDRMREIASGIKVSQTGSKEDVEQWKTLLNTYLTAFDWDAAESTVKKILEAVPADEYSLDVYKKLQTWKDYVIKDETLLEYKGISNVIDIPYGVKILRGIYKNYCSPISQQPGEKTLKIPETVTDIECVIDIALYREIFIPNSVKNIPYNAFSFHVGRLCNPYDYRDNFVKIYLPKRFISQKFKAYDYDFDCAISQNEISHMEKQGWIVDRTTYPARGHVNYEPEDFIFYDENETYETIKAWEKAEAVKKSIELAEEERGEKERANRRALGVCQHCGGVFKGFFNPRCTSCGKEKDY